MSDILRAIAAINSENVDCTRVRQLTTKEIYMELALKG